MTLATPNRYKESPTPRNTGDRASNPKKLPTSRPAADAPRGRRCGALLPSARASPRRCARRRTRSGQPGAPARRYRAAPRLSVRSSRREPTDHRPSVRRTRISARARARDAVSAAPRASGPGPSATPSDSSARAVPAKAATNGSGIPSDRAACSTSSGPRPTSSRSVSPASWSRRTAWPRVRSEPHAAQRTSRPATAGRTRSDRSRSQAPRSHARRRSSSPSAVRTRTSEPAHDTRCTGASQARPVRERRGKRHGEAIVSARTECVSNSPNDPAPSVRALASRSSAGWPQLISSLARSASPTDASRSSRIQCVDHGATATVCAGSGFARPRPELLRRHRLSSARLPVPVERALAHQLQAGRAIADVISEYPGSTNSPPRSTDAARKRDRPHASADAVARLEHLHLNPARG